MGHSHRFLPPGQGLPEGLGAGFLCQSRSQMFVAGLCSTTMHGIETESRSKGGPAVAVYVGACARRVGRRHVLHGNRVLSGFRHTPVLRPAC